MENIMSSKLFRTRQGTILLGLVAAVLAAIVLVVYLNQYRNSVNKGVVPLQVLEAKSLIPKGTSGDIVASTALYRTANVAKSQVNAGAIVDPSELAGKVALKDIDPGQQLTESDFGAGTNSVSQELASGQRAVVVPLDSPSSVGGQISAGDHVDVWALLNTTTPVAREILQNMYVLGVNSDGNVTVRATPTQAGELIFASNNAKIWLTLRPVRGSVTKKPAVITPNSLLGG